MKMYTTISAGFLAVIAVLHLLRLLFGWKVIFGTTMIPIWPSVIIAIALGFLSIMLWRESNTV